MSSLIFSHCKRCGRPIKNPKAQAIGYGKVCLKKHLAEAEHLLKNGIARDEHGQESLTSFIF
jgi:RNA polymerase-binding transcription factor DksA